MKQPILIFFLFVSFSVNAFEFAEAIKQLKMHDAIKIINQRAESIKNRADKNGSWGDPKFKVSFKNFPTENLSYNRTPMTGIEFGISQKIGLTTKYGHKKETLLNLSTAKRYEAKSQKENLVRLLWINAIKKRETTEDIKVLKESLEWIMQILSVSKRLYSLGKITQQAFLDVKIRHAEIRSKIDDLKFNNKRIDQEIKYLYDAKSVLKLQSVPWNMLKLKVIKKNDYKELALKSKATASIHKLRASQLAYVPDVTLNVGYTKRSNIDGVGDFVSASVTFPLPFSDTQSSDLEDATHQKYESEYKVKNYNLMRKRDSEKLTINVKKLKKELKILTRKTIQYAIDSRKITAKSYSVGKATYFELMRAELKLQNLKQRKNMIEASIAKSQVNLRYILGGALYE